MISAFLMFSAVLINFCAGFAAAKVISLPKKGSVPQKCEPNSVAARQIAEYRNFLSYDGTEQEEVE